MRQEISQNRTKDKNCRENSHFPDLDVDGPPRTNRQLVERQEYGLKRAHCVHCTSSEAHHWEGLGALARACVFRRLPLGVITEVVRFSFALQFTQRTPGPCRLFGHPCCGCGSTHGFPCDNQSLDLTEAKQNQPFRWSPAGNGGRYPGVADDDRNGCSGDASRLYRLSQIL